MERLARVTVSSSRTTTSPALTRSPSRTRTSPTTPPVGCCTFLILVSTTIEPGAISAPDNSVVAAQPPTPPTSMSTTVTPATMWRWIDSLVSTVGLSATLSSRLPARF